MSSTGVMKAGDTPSQCSTSSISPMTPPSVMPVCWWMLWMPKVQIMAPSTISPTRRRVSPSSRRRSRPAAVVLRLRNIKISSCILGWFLYTTSIKDIVTIVSRGRHEKEREPVLHRRGGEVSEHFQADADLLRQGGAVPRRLGGPGKRLPLLQRQPAGLSGHHPDHEADRLFATGDQGPYAALRPG